MNNYPTCRYCGNAYVPDTERPGAICDACLADCCVTYLTALWPTPMVATLHECPHCGKEWRRAYDEEMGRFGWEEVLPV